MFEIVGNLITHLALAGGIIYLARGLKIAAARIAVLEQRNQ